MEKRTCFQHYRIESGNIFKDIQNARSCISNKYDKHNFNNPQLTWINQSNLNASHYFVFNLWWLLLLISDTCYYKNACSSHMQSEFINQFPEYIFRKYYYDIYYMYSHSVALYGCFWNFSFLRKIHILWWDL